MAQPLDLSLHLLIEHVRDHAIVTLDPTSIITSGRGFDVLLHVAGCVTDLFPHDR